MNHAFHSILLLVTLCGLLQTLVATAQQFPADSIRVRVEAERKAERDSLDGSLRRLSARGEEMKHALKDFKDAVCMDKRFVTGGMDSIQKSLHKALNEVKEAFVDERVSMSEFGAIADSLFVNMHNENFAASEEFDLSLSKIKKHVADLRLHDDVDFTERLDGLMDALKRSISRTVEFYVEEFPAGGPVQQASIDEQALQTSEGKPAQKPYARKSSSEGVSTFSAGLTYMSNFSYMGRTTGTQQAALVPSALYVHRSGFYAMGNLYWFSKQTPHTNELDLNIGYMTRPWENVSASVGYTRLFYKDSSAKFTQQRTLSNGTVSLTFRDNPQNKIDLNLAYTLGSIVEFSGVGEYLFGGGQDFDLHLSMRYNIRCGKVFSGWELALSPEAGCSFSSLNHYKLSRNTATLEFEMERSISGIEVVDYEILMPLTCSLGGLTISPALIIDLPQNEAKNVSGSCLIAVSLTVLIKL
jgi:hypothetical protein